MANTKGKINKLITPDFGGAHPLNAIISAAAWWCKEPTDEEKQHTELKCKNPTNFYKWIEDNDITVTNFEKNKLTPDFFYRVRQSILKCFKLASINDLESFDFDLDIKDHKNDIIKKLSSTDIKNYEKLNDWEKNQYHFINNYIQIIQNENDSAKSSSVAFKEMLKFMSENPTKNDAHKLFYAFSLYSGRIDFKSLYDNPQLETNYYTAVGGKKSQETASATRFGAFCNLMYELNLTKTPGKTCQRFENNSVVKMGSDYLTKPLPVPTQAPYTVKEVSQILPILQDWDNKKVTSKELKQKFFKKYPHLENIPVADLCEYFSSLADYYLNKSKTHDLKHFLSHTRTNRDGYPIGHIPGGYADYYWKEKIAGAIVCFTSEATKYNNKADTFKNEFEGISEHIIKYLKANNLPDGVIIFTSNFDNEKEIRDKWNKYVSAALNMSGKTVHFEIVDYKKKAYWLNHPKEYESWKKTIPQLLDEEDERIKKWSMDQVAAASKRKTKRTKDQRK